MAMVLSLTGVAFFDAPALAARCYGRDPCNACRNCSACAHCNSGGNPCGVMKAMLGSSRTVAPMYVPPVYAPRVATPRVPRPVPRPSRAVVEQSASIAPSASGINSDDFPTGNQWKIKILPYKTYGMPESMVRFRYNADLVPENIPMWNAWAKNLVTMFDRKLVGQAGRSAGAEVVALYVREDGKVLVKSGAGDAGGAASAESAAGGASNLPILQRVAAGLAGDARLTFPTSPSYDTVCVKARVTFGGGDVWGRE